MKAGLVARYILFVCAFVLVIAGLILQSYPLLAITVVFAVILCVVADKIETRLTKSYERYNALHERSHHSQSTTMGGHR